MFARVSGKSLLLLFLAIAVALPTSSLATLEVHAEPCQVLQFDTSYPPTVAPGEAFQVTSTISLACYQWRTYYGGRVDIVDPASNTVLSISTFEIGTMPNVNVTVSNSATAPQAEGSWDLQLILYILESGGIVGSVKRTINIQVQGQNVSTTQQMTSTASFEISTTSPQTTPPTAAASETITMATTSQTPPLETGGPLAALTENSLVVIAALALLAIVLAALAMRTRRRRPAPQAATLSQVFCGKCGAKNAVTSEFCVNCGKKLEQMR
jgi:hypothetical protein